MTSETTPAPDNGIYEDVPSEDYHAWDDVLSKSKLWSMVLGVNGDGSLELCPARYQFMLNNPQPYNPDYAVGGALDCLMLEPHEFNDRYVMAGSCCAPKKKGSDEVCGSPGKVLVDGEWRCGTHGRGGEGVPEDKELLDHILMSQVRAMERSLRADPLGMEYFNRPHLSQVAMVGTVLGRRFKGRADLAGKTDGGWLVDLKTTRMKSVRAFQQDAIRMGYAVQMFLYNSLLFQHGVMGAEPDVALWVVGKTSLFGCGKEAVHPVWFCPMDEEVLLLGMRQLQQLIDTFDRCCDEDNWPVRMEDRTYPISLPGWMKTDDPLDWSDSDE